MSAEKKIAAARTALILDQPFFGVLALRLRIEADPSQPTAWVDGRTLGFNPEWIEGLSHSQTVALVAHEVMHCACGHPWRRDGRDQKRWNAACDYAINPILVESHFTLPDGGLIDPQYQGKSAEWIFDRLPQPQEPDKPEGEEPEEGEGEGEQSAQGEVRDAPEETTEDAATEGDWNAAVQQAAKVAASQGKAGRGVEAFAAQAAKPRVDWRSALRRFVQETAAADYVWSRPSPRFIARGLYLPSLRSEEMGPMVIAIDTSGSIDTVLLSQFGAEMRAVVEDMNPLRVEVLYCDTAIQKRETFERGDPVELKANRGGGTRFEPVFEAIAEMDEPPACLVYFTDLYGSFPTQAPEVPTLWATETEGRDVPFGEVLEIGGAL